MVKISPRYDRFHTDIVFYVQHVEEPHLHDLENENKENHMIFHAAEKTLLRKRNS